MIPTTDTQSLSVRMTPDSELLLTIEEAAKHTQLSKRKLQLDMASGALAYVKFGRSVRFLPKDLNDYIQARRIHRRRI